MDRVIEMLISIYYFYKGAAKFKRFREAEDIAELLGEQFLKPEKANGTWWVDHKLRLEQQLNLLKIGQSLSLRWRIMLKTSQIKQKIGQKLGFI